MLVELTSVFIASFISLLLFIRLARKIQLVDKPNARKLHDGAVPLVGGISSTSIISLFLLFTPDLMPNTYLYIACIAVLAVMGAIDDKFDISFKIRMSIQAILCLVVIFYGGISIENLGNLFGNGDIHLGGWGIIITLLAVIGAINAFNMVDGIDGLLGGLSMVTFGSLAFLLYNNGQNGEAMLCLLFVAALLPYICMNLGICGQKRKIFMGDAGSMVIGFTVVWLLMSLSQPGAGKATISPVTALWLIAIPLMDMAAIMIRRVRRGDSPFKPDREHLHHIFQRIGFSSRKTLVTITLVACGFAGIGLWAESAQVNDHTMFVGFLATFTLYLMGISYIFRITKFIRREQSLNKPVKN